jgi:cellulose synthase/poly-beta-1,6-N-acetylglucosamine synthase-like glycosyltransferase
MSLVAHGVLWGALALLLYAYFFYPALLWVLGRRLPSPPAGAAALGDWPRISITVPAYNEEMSIAATLERLLATDYPADRRQILVVSDASTDRTDAIVGSYASRGVELLRLPTRVGKTAAENAARDLLTGDIVVNTDASVAIHPRALKPLVKAFADPQVGVASGRDVSVAGAAAGADHGESRYVGYEMWVRDLETRVWGIVGASGCLYAVRRALHMDLVPAALSRDFAAALTAREQGYRSVSVVEATCQVPRAASLRREYHRKVRTMTRGLETLWHKRHLLNPFRYGVFAWLLFSHKFCRWLMPWAVVVSAAAFAVLAPGEWWARDGLAIGAALGVLGGAAWLWPERRPMPALLAGSAYVVWGAVAAIDAWLRALRGELNPVWEPTRRGRADVPTPPNS